MLTNFSVRYYYPISHKSLGKKWFYTDVIYGLIQSLLMHELVLNCTSTNLLTNAIPSCRFHRLTLMSQTYRYLT